MNEVVFGAKHESGEAANTGGILDSVIVVEDTVASVCAVVRL